MKLNAVGITSKDFFETVRFYEMLGFQFPEVVPGEAHIESINPNQAVRLMVDSVELIENLLGTKPLPSNHSHFAIECEGPDQVNLIARRIKDAGFVVMKEPWDAFWGQRYAVVRDPDGYMVDLYARL